MLPSLRNYAMTFIISLVIFGLLAYFFTVFAMRSFSTDGEDTEPTETTAAVTEVGIFDPFASIDEPDTSTIQGESFNFVLIGLDYQPEVFEDYPDNMLSILKQALSGKQSNDIERILTYAQQRNISADGILIGRVDREERRLFLTALSGNTRVFIDGVYTDLGSVLVNKGMSFFTAKITAMTGLTINYYAVASIPAMTSIIDRLGGISYNVPCEMNYEDPEEGLVISLKPGTQWLSGTTALQVLRYASYEDRDITRMSVMRDMASSMMTTVASYTTLANAPELYKSLKSSITTNFSFADFTDRLDLIFRLGDFSVVNYSYPGTMAVYNGDPYFVPDIPTALNALAQYR